MSITSDSTYESNETFTATLSGASGAGLGSPTTTTVTITEVAAPSTLQFKSGTYTVTENGGSVRIYVSRANGSYGPASVNYATANGTASAGSDYTAKSGTLNWTDGDAADKYFDVLITDDSAYEGNEGFTATLSGASGAALGSPTTTTVTISDEEDGQSARLVRIVDTPAGGGSAVVPITLAAQGTENAIGFSLSFDTTRLTYSEAAKGSDATGATVNTNTGQAAAGLVGISLALPAGQTFSVGTKQIVLVTFNVVGVSTGSTPIAFGDQPIGRELVDATANALPANWVGGSVQLCAGYEGDAAPKPSGNGTISIADWVQVGRYAAGLDLLPSSTCDCMKVDCAPRASLGNGTVTISDWVQAGRYAAGLDPLSPVGGPACGAKSDHVLMSGQDASALSCTLRVQSVTMAAGQSKVTAIQLDASGTENAIGCSVAFDPAILTITAALGPGATGATLNVNSHLSASGKLGIALALPAGQTFPAGTHDVVTLQLTAAATAVGSTSILFGDQPIAREVVDAAANTVSAAYSPGTVTLGLATAWYRDADGDGHGNPSDHVDAVSQPNGYVADATDCDDSSAAVYPGASEVADNGIDEDCDGYDVKTWYRDADGDGYGNSAVTTLADTQPTGYVADHTDCNDNNPAVHPGATEMPGNGVDEDCDGFDLPDEPNDQSGSPERDAPSVTISSPSNGEAFAVESVTVTGTAADLGSSASGVATVQVRVNGGQWQTASGTTQWTATVVLTTGANTIEAQSIDIAGNNSAIASTSVTCTPLVPEDAVGMCPGIGTGLVTISIVGLALTRGRRAR